MNTVNTTAKNGFVIRYTEDNGHKRFLRSVNDPPRAAIFCDRDTAERVALTLHGADILDLSEDLNCILIK